MKVTNDSLINENGSRDSAEDKGRELSDQRKPTRKRHLVAIPLRRD